MWAAPFPLRLLFRGKGIDYHRRLKIISFWPIEFPLSLRKSRLPRVKGIFVCFPAETEREVFLKLQPVDATNEEVKK